MRNGLTTCIAVVGLLAGCSTGAPNSLGITGYQVTEGKTALEIVGRDAQQQAVASLVISLGTFHDLETDHDYEGRTVTIDAVDQKVVVNSVGFEPTELTLRDKPSVFVQDPAVAGLAAHWGVTFKIEGN